jgi:hypothetical protein
MRQGATSTTKAWFGFESLERRVLRWIALIMYGQQTGHTRCPNAPLAWDFGVWIKLAQIGCASRHRRVSKQTAAQQLPAESAQESVNQGNIARAIF